MTVISNADTSAQLIETSQSVIIDAGTLEFSEEDLTATGLLTPYGVKCRSNLGEFTVDTGVFTAPADLTGAALNIEHKREDVVGAVTKVWEQPEGLFASFKFAATDEGRQAFAEAKEGKRKNLSAEVARVRIKDGKAVSGRIFGAALVERPAFEGATLLAAEDTPDPVTEPDAYADFLAKVQADIASALALVTEQISAPAEDEESTPTAAPAEESTESDDYEEFSMSDNTEAGAAQVPATLLAAGVTQPRDVTPEQVIRAITSIKNGASDRGDAETLLAALADVKISGTGAVPANGVLQTDWVGKLWQGKAYERRFIQLTNHGTNITAAGKKGFRIFRGTSSSPVTMLGGDWSGNKVELPTGTAHTDTISSTLHKFAFAADFAREYWDLPGGEEVVAAFIQLVMEDYAVWSDEKALAAIAAAAGEAVAPGTFPTEYSEAMGMLIQGVRAVNNSKGTPSYALINAAAADQILFTPKDLVPEYVSFNITTEGTGLVDGKVNVVEAPDSAFIGVDPDEPAVIVGEKNAVEVDEKGATPLEVSALDIARGGVDRAFHGYLQVFTPRPEGVVLIGTDAA